MQHIILNKTIFTDFSALTNTTICTKSNTLGYTNKYCSFSTQNDYGVVNYSLSVKNEKGITTKWGGKKK